MRCQSRRPGAPSARVIHSEPASVGTDATGSHSLHNPPLMRMRVGERSDEARAHSRICTLKDARLPLIEAIYFCSYLQRQVPAPHGQWAIRTLTVIHALALATKPSPTRYHRTSVLKTGKSEL